ncbi:LysR family transcriptional regulator [bacterium]|nr:MAG: LysR family transcriptional regulator [bacterium]
MPFGHSPHILVAFPFPIVVFMEIRHLKYFVAVAEEMNVTRAAARLFMTQPTLSRQIKDLEKQLDVELFQRSPAGWSLSPAGRELLPQARQLLELANQTALSMRRFSDCRKHSLAIGYITPALGSFLGSALSILGKQHPEIEVRLFELSPGVQMEALREGRLDIALVGHCGEQLRREFDIAVIRQIPLNAVLPHHHPLSGQQVVALGDLKDESFIGYSETTFTGRNEIIASTCRSAGFTPRFVYEADGLSSALAIIGSNLGISLLPEDAKQLPHPESVFRPLSPSAHIEFCAAMQIGEKRPTVRNFLKFLTVAAT